MRARIYMPALLTAWLVGACIGTTPQEQDPSVQGNYRDGDEEHRPGQPCLLCHGTGHLLKSPGETTFAIAGTVYGRIDDAEDAGLDRVDVEMADAEGRVFTATTNRVGNFMVQVNSGASEPRDKGKGKLDIPWSPTFPLSVVIRRGEDEQIMRTHIWRDGSCAHCHGARPGAASVGRVYLFQDVTQ